jgi:hypothetical protein
VLFTPTADFNGPASFEYTLQDDGTTNGAADPLTATAAASFTITEVNDVPVGGNDPLSSVAEDSGQRTISFASLLANDVAGPANESGQTLTIIAVGSAVGGTVSISGTDVLFTPAPDFNGPASFEYTVQDNGTTNGAADPQTGTATVSFTVTPVNDAPTLTVPGAQTAYEDVDLAFSGISVGDVDNATLTTTLQVSNGTLTVGTTTGLTVTGNGTGLVQLSGSIADLNTALASLLYRGNLNFSGADSLQITVDDGSLSTNGSVALTVKSIFEQADDLKAQVNALVSAGVLSNSQGKSLNRKLSLTGNASQNANKVEDFIAQVNGLVSDGTLTSAQADPLLAAANILLVGINVD